MNRKNDTTRKNKKIIISSISIGFIFTVLFGIFTNVYANNVQSGIAGQVIRFHVLANSDSEEDQNLKLKVRDGILAEFKDELEKSENISQTREILLNNMDKIKECAEVIIQQEGYNYTVSASLSIDKFPTKDYGDISFPAGKYEALRIVIGEGKGKNWWCVMFPPLCFVDATHNEIPEESKQELKNILTDEEYDIVVRAKSEENIPIKIKFKIVELWQGK